MFTTMAMSMLSVPPVPSSTDKVTEYSPTSSTRAMTRSVPLANAVTPFH